MHLANNSGAQNVVHLSWSIMSLYSEHRINLYITDFAYYGQISLVPTCSLNTKFTAFEKKKHVKMFTTESRLFCLQLILTLRNQVVSCCTGRYGGIVFHNQLANIVVESSVPVIYRATIIKLVTQHVVRGDFWYQKWQCVLVMLGLLPCSNRFVLGLASLFAKVV